MIFNKKQYFEMINNIENIYKYIVERKWPDPRNRPLTRYWPTIEEMQEDNDRYLYNKARRTSC